MFIKILLGLKIVFCQRWKYPPPSTIQCICERKVPSNLQSSCKRPKSGKNCSGNKWSVYSFVGIHRCEPNFTSAVSISNSFSVVKQILNTVWVEKAFHSIKIHAVLNRNKEFIIAREEFNYSIFYNSSYNFQQKYPGMGYKHFQKSVKCPFLEQN